MSNVNCCAVNLDTGYCWKCRSFPQETPSDGVLCEELVKDLGNYDPESGDYIDNTNENRYNLTLREVLSIEQPEKFGMLD